MTNASPDHSVHLRPSRPLRAIDRLLARAGIEPDLTHAGFRRRATMTTGLDRFGDADWEARLESLTRGLAENDNLSTFGRWTAAIYYHFRLENKLRVQARLAADPSIEASPLEAPIFIVGWYRTGTTRLHTLMGAHAGLRALAAWELLTPHRVVEHRGLDRAIRRFRAKVTMGLGSFIVPESEQAHPFEIDWPEEDFFLLEIDLVGPTGLHMHMLYGYAEELLSIDATPAYVALRKQLQLLQREAPSKRFVLKAPIHLWNVDALMNAFPDARIVFTHREPIPALLSNCSLSAMTATKASAEPALHRLGRFWFDYYRVGMERAFAARERIPEHQRIDVPISALANDTIGTIAKIYDRFEVPFGPEDCKKTQAAMASEVGKSRGSHRYSAEMFGLDEAEINAAFVDYRAFYEKLSKEWADA